MGCVDPLCLQVQDGGIAGDGSLEWLGGGLEHNLSVCLPLPFSLTLILCLPILFVFLIVFCFHASFSVLPLPHHSLRSTFLNTPPPPPRSSHTNSFSMPKANLWSFRDWFIHVKEETIEGASVLCWRRGRRQLGVQAVGSRRFVSFYAFLETKKWKSVVVLRRVRQMWRNWNRDSFN